MSFKALQDHTLSRVLELPGRAAQLKLELRGILLKASDEGRIRTSPREVHGLVEILPEPPAALAELRQQGLYTSACCIVGGDKNQERDRGLRHFARDDEAWFDFSITVREHDSQLTLLAYDFEIRFPPGTGTPFLRFDLNLPEHRNEARELRAHMHPGSDDIIVPAPMMSRPSSSRYSSMACGSPRTEPRREARPRSRSTGFGTRTSGSPRDSGRARLRHLDQCAPVAAERFTVEGWAAKDIVGDRVTMAVTEVIARPTESTTADVTARGSCRRRR